MTHEIMTNLEDSLPHITLILKHLREARQYEEDLIKSAGKHMEGGLYVERHKEVSSDLTEAINAMTQAEEYICAALK